MDGRIAITKGSVLVPEKLTEAIRHANLEPRQLSVSSSMSYVGRMVCPDSCLDLMKLGPSLLFTGAMPSDSYTVLYVRHCPTPGQAFVFSIEHQDGYIAVFPPGGTVDAVTPEGYASVTLTISIPRFHQILDEAYPEIPDSVRTKGGAFKVKREERHDLNEVFRLVEQCLADPGVLPDCSVLEDRVADAFFSTLSRSIDNGRPSPTVRYDEQTRKLRQARDFVRAHVHESLNVIDLCRELNMSRRGLEFLFHRTVGLTPGSFIRNRKLHGVRQSLLVDEPRPGAVKQAALEWGFWHLGHFSRNYRSLFGESPSETLKRSA